MLAPEHLSRRGGRSPRVGSGNDARSEKPCACGRREGRLLNLFFPFGGAITTALREEDLSLIIERAFLKRPRTAWRCARIVEVVSPRAVENALVKGVSVEHYRQIKEFSFSEQSKS